MQTLRASNAIGHLGTVAVKPHGPVSQNVSIRCVAFRFDKYYSTIVVYSLMEGP